MSIEQTSTIDFISVEPGTDLIVLTVSDHLEWPNDASDHLVLMQEKLNSYLRFIESGEVLESHPKAQGKKPLIDVVLKFRPSEQGIDFFRKAQAIVEDSGIQFQYRVLEDMERPKE